MAAARISTTTATRKQLGLAFVCRRLPFLLFGWMLSIVVLSSYDMVSQITISSSSPSLPEQANIPDKRKHHGNVVAGGGGRGRFPDADDWKLQSHLANAKSAIKQSVTENNSHVDQQDDIHIAGATETTTRGMKESGISETTGNDGVATNESVGNSENLTQVLTSDIQEKKDSDDSESVNAAVNIEDESKNLQAAASTSEASENSIIPGSHNTVIEVEGETNDSTGEAKSNGSTDSKEANENTNTEPVDSLEATKERTRDEGAPAESTNNNNEESDKSASRVEEKQDSIIDVQSDIKADVNDEIVNDAASKDAEKQTHDAATLENAGSGHEAATDKDGDADSSNATKVDEGLATTVEKSNFRKAVKEALKANDRHSFTATKKHTIVHHSTATKNHTADHVLESSTTTNNKPTIVSEADSDIKDFAKNPDVVIAVKIHGPPHVIQLKQSLCLLTKAYNNRPNHDILVFVTDPLSNIHVQELRDIVHPAKLTVETDKKTLSRHIREMTPNQTAALLEQCGKNSTDDLFWWTRCGEEKMPLAYNWQAEFRSKWIWYNKELAKYKWMMWYDSDAMATRLWDQDPVAFAIRNELKILFDHFPQGHRAHHELRGMMEDAYNGDYVCHVNLVNGHLEAHRPAAGCNKPNIPQIHGFFHITDLNFYRSAANLKWFDNMIADRKFSRMWDDQIAVTVPAAVLAANKSWDMHQNGVWLDVYHNQHFDGDRNRRHRGGGFVHWWETLSKTKFPEAVESCGPLVKNSG